MVQSCTEEYKMTLLAELPQTPPPPPRLLSLNVGIRGTNGIKSFIVS